MAFVISFDEVLPGTHLLMGEIYDGWELDLIYACFSLFFLPSGLSSRGRGGYNDLEWRKGQLVSCQVITTYYCLLAWEEV